MLLSKFFRRIKLIKGSTKDRKGPQRSIIQDHRGSAIMRKLPDLQKCRVLFLSNYFTYIFVKLYFCVVFVNFRVLMRLNDLWRFTTVTVLMSATTLQYKTMHHTPIQAIITHRPTV